MMSAPRALNEAAELLNQMKAEIHEKNQKKAEGP